MAKNSRSALLPIFLIVLVDILGLTLILPLLPFYAEKLGASPKVVGLLVSVFAFCQLISGPILGQLSDRTGRKPLLLVSQFGTLVGFIILAQAETLWLVFLSRIIDGFTAGNLSLAQAYISDVTEPSNRAKAFGVIGVAFGLGFLVGPGVSGYLSQYGYHYPVWAAVGLSALSIVATWFLLPSASTVPVREYKDGAVGPGGRRLTVFQFSAYGEFFKRPELGPLLVEFFLFVLSFALFTAGFALFCERRFTHDGVPFGPREVGYIFAFSGFLGIFLQGGLIGRLVKRYGERKLVTAGFISSVLGYVLLAFAPSVPFLLVSAMLGSFGNSSLRPALTSLVTQKADRHEQGVILGLTQSLMSIAQIISPAVGGLMIEHGMLTGWALVAASFCLLALGFARHAYRNTSPAT
jgi:DHA1 family tetracycline resistance protein-like MFS transporter